MSAELRVVITGDGSGLSQAFARAKTQAGAFANSIRTGVIGSISGQFASLVSIGVLTGLSAKTISFAGHMRDLADTLKVNVEWLQKFRNAAVATGSSEDDFAAFMVKVQASRQAAFNKPNSAQGQAFGRLGFSPGEISGANSLSPQAFVEKLVKAFSEGGAEAENDIRTVGGRSAYKLVNAFRQGIDDAGPIISEDLIDALDDIGDEFEVLKTQLMVDLAPAIVTTANALNGFLGWIREIGAYLGGLFLSRAPGSVADQNDERGMSPKQKEVLRRAQKAKGWVFGDGDSQAGQAALDVEKKDGQRREVIRSQRQAERAARRRRESSGPNFTADEKDAKEPRAQKVQAIKTDALSKAGLFTVSGLLARPNPVEQEQLKTLRKIEENTREQADHGTDWDD